ncbi:MAG: hypothetical protein ACKOFF_02635 [Acidimicrobiales bacterium]
MTGIRWEEDPGTTPQRHSRQYRWDSTRKEGWLVVLWWFFQFHQYVHGTIFGYLMYRQDKAGKFTSKRLSKWSHNYVVICLATCVVLTVSAFVARTNNTVFFLVCLVGGLRLYEVVFAQSYYLLQTRRTTVSSFTRTFLFHILFLIEGILYAAAVNVHYTVVLSVQKAVGFAFLAVTLQTNFLDASIAPNNFVQAAHLGCNVLGLVIFLASLPVLVGSVAKTWSQAKFD